MERAGDDVSIDDNEALVTRLRTGDETAFVELYTRHHRRLVSHLGPRLSDPHLAEEVAQETFYRAYLALGELRPPYHIYAWLKTVAWRVSADHYRKAAKLRLEPDIELGADPSAEDFSSAALDHEPVRIALGRVRRRHREVLLLQAREDLSYEQIAARIGTPVTAVPPLLRRARRALRREYLAVTQADSVLGLAPLLVCVTAQVRRFRARVGQAIHGLPDLSGSVASLVVGVTAVIASVSGIHSSAEDRFQVKHGWQAAAETSQVPIHESPLGPRTTTIPRVGNAHDRPVPPPGSGGPAAREVVVPRIARVATDGPGDPGWEEAREQARRMPIVIEHGDFLVAVDLDAARHGTEGEISGLSATSP